MELFDHRKKYVYIFISFTVIWIRIEVESKGSEPFRIGTRIYGTVLTCCGTWYARNKEAEFIIFSLWRKPFKLISSFERSRSFTGHMSGRLLPIRKVKVPLRIFNQNRRKCKFKEKVCAKLFWLFLNRSVLLTCLPAWSLLYVYSGDVYDFQQVQRLSQNSVAVCDTSLQRYLADFTGT